MRLKTIWMQLLLIGILSSLASCYTQVDRRFIEEFYFMNKSGTDITIESFIFVTSDSYKDTFSLKNDSTLFQQTDLFFGSRTDVVALADSLSISFGANGRIQFLLSDTLSPYNVLNRNNYELVVVSDNLRKYTYTFTVADVSNALGK